MKICSFCGHPIGGPSCPLCKYDHATGYEGLADYHAAAPSEVRFVRRPYRDWLERFDAYATEMLALVPSQGGLVIDVGCGPSEFGRRLRQQFPSLNVVGYDQYPLSPDVVRHDFEAEPLPHGDGEADVVILSHVAEHIERLHFVLDEVLRVGRYALIVLPNALTVFALARLLLGRGIGPLYGLPLVSPKDRHRWFYTASDAQRLIAWYAHRYRRRYHVVYFVHPRVPVWAGRLSPNLLCSEVMFVVRPQ